LFKKYPALRDANTKPNQIASNILFNTFMRMRQPLPTMEEAMINVDTMMYVLKEMERMATENTWNQFDYYNGKTGIGGKKQHKFTKKEQEELR